METWNKDDRCTLRYIKESDLVQCAGCSKVLMKYSDEPVCSRPGCRTGVLREGEDGHARWFRSQNDHTYVAGEKSTR